MLCFVLSEIFVNSIYNKTFMKMEVLYWQKGSQKVVWTHEKFVPVFDLSPHNLNNTAISASSNYYKIKPSFFSSEVAYLYSI